MSKYDLSLQYIFLPVAILKCYFANAFGSNVFEHF